VKQRLQAGQYSSAIEGLKIIFYNDGILSLFGQGKLFSQIVRDVPYAIFTLISYELLQDLAAKIRHSIEVSESREMKIDSKRNRLRLAVRNLILNKKVNDALCGAIAGGIGSFLTNPMDVVKTRLMTRKNDNSPSSVVSMIQSIITNEGWATFFVGSYPRLVHKIPANGLFFVVYETIRSILGVKRD
jgi:hypothetical protein